MAREWTVEATITLIIAKLAVIAPENQAMIPFTITKEGKLWHIDVMVKKPHCEYDVHGESDDLRIALKGVYKRLGNWQILERSSIR